MDKRIVEWIKKKGYTFELSDKDLYDPDERKIYVKKRLSKHHRLYAGLHECGHLLVQQNIFSYEKRYKTQVDGVMDGRKRSSLRYRIDFLKEEYDAWDRGFRLAKRLGIYVNKDNYYNYASKCLGSYCQWVVAKDWRKWE